MSIVQTEHPTLIIVNGRMWTGTPTIDATAVAIQGNKIMAVGCDSEIKSLATKQTRIIDADQCRIIPGITDSHTHLLYAGLQLTRLSMNGATCKRDFIGLIADAARNIKPEQWILGCQYSVENWKQPEQPSKDWIDEFTGDNPLLITRSDLHMALVNSRTLQLAGITREGPKDPPGGEIQRDFRTGEPTGLLKDAAMQIVFDLAPTPSEADNLHALQTICRKSNRWGITSIHDMSLPEDLAVFNKQNEAGQLTLRINSFVETPDFRATLPSIKQYRSADPMLRVAGFKAFVDGSLGSRTAYMKEPYMDASEDTRYPCGMRARCAANWTDFCDMLRWGHEQGAQLAVHAIGDQANSDILSFFESLSNPGSHRHRIEHVQHLNPEDVPRFAKSGIIASLQPAHKADDGPWAETAIGSQRLHNMYAWRSLIESGARLCFGSDVPVVPNNPYYGVFEAVSGQLADGRTCIPEQNISREQALSCYTVSPPFAVFREHELGTIEPGKLADLAILDGDLLETSIENLPGIVARTTVLGGNVVWPPC